MSEKRYFKVEYDEEWYLFDSNTISEELVVEQAEYGYGVFANSLSPSEVVDLLNEQQNIIHRDEISIKTMMSNMKKLEEENKQLKQEHKVVIDEMITDYKNLEEENEELKEIHQKGSKSCEKWKQHKEAQIQQLEKMNEDLREVNKENRLLHEENVKQCERWKNLYEIKDAEVTARVDTLNRVCEYYLSETRFKGDIDPNDAVKEVINEILNAPIYEE